MTQIQWGKSRHCQPRKMARTLTGSWDRTQTGRVGFVPPTRLGYEAVHVHVGRRETCLFSISNHLPRNQCHSPLPVRMQLLPLNCIPRHNCFKYPATNDIDIKDVSFYGVIRSRSSVLFFFFALSNRTRPGALVRNTRHRYPSVRDDGQLTGAVGMGRAICLLVPTGAPWIGRYCRVS